MQNLETKFTQRLLENLNTAESQYGCRCERLRRKVQEFGGVAAVKDLIRRGQFSDGFSQLAAAGALKYSSEALCVAAEFGALFTDEEVNFCFAALCDEGYYQWSAR